MLIRHVPAPLAAALVAFTYPASQIAWDGAEIASLADRIAKEHGLVREDPIRVTVMPREKLRARLENIVAHEYSAEEIVDEGRLLKRLGLLPESTSYDEIVYGLLEEQILGLYDQAQGELVLLEDAPDPMLAESVLVHEITHAVQDMNFDLGALAERRPGEGDRIAALEAVAEGDAVLMEQVLTGLILPDGITAEQMDLLLKLQPLEVPALQKAPPFIRSSLLFPYIHGFVMVRHVYSTGGYAAINQLFLHPPGSTEQILHPEKLGADPPIPVPARVPEDLSSLYRVAVDDVMGEFGLRTWLEQWVTGAEARSAAEGWGGDRISLLWPASTLLGPAHLGHGIVVLSSTWDAGPAQDPDREVREFAAAVEAYLAARYGGSEMTATASGAFLSIPGDQVAIVDRRGREVLFVEGLASAEPPAIAALVEAIWTSGAPP